VEYIMATNVVWNAGKAVPYERICFGMRSLSETSRLVFFNDLALSAAFPTLSFFLNLPRGLVSATK